MTPPLTPPNEAYINHDPHIKHTSKVGLEIDLEFWNKLQTNYMSNKAIALQNEYTMNHNLLMILKQNFFFRFKPSIKLFTAPRIVISLINLIINI